MRKKERGRKQKRLRKSWKLREREREVDIARQTDKQTDRQI